MKIILYYQADVVSTYFISLFGAISFFHQSCSSLHSFFKNKISLENRNELSIN